MQWLITRVVYKWTNVINFTIQSHVDKIIRHKYTLPPVSIIECCSINMNLYQSTESVTFVLRVWVWVFRLFVLEIIYTFLFFKSAALSPRQNWISDAIQQKGGSVQPCNAAAIHAYKLIAYRNRGPLVLDIKMCFNQQNIN